MPYISGTVRDDSGAPVVRTIRFYRRDTGTLLGSTDSSGAAVQGDPHFDKVSLLLHFDGADGGTTFTDSSTAPKAVTAIGDAKISTAQTLFGGSTGYFDGAGDALSVANSAALDFGTGDFAIECWVYIAGNSAPDKDGYRSCTIVSPWSADVSGYIFGITGSTTTTGTGLQLDSWGDASGNGSLFRAAAPMPQNSWHHVAASVASGVRRLFLNGVQLSGAPITVGAGYAPFDTFGRALRVGRSLSSTYPLPLNGYLKELRITKGVARYTANFTPPTTAFPDTDITVPARALGEYHFPTDYTGEVTVVCLDDSVGALENDLILRAYAV